MLTDEEKYKNQTNFISLLKTLNIDLTQLLAYLEHINYFEKPYTAQYNGSYAGGLCEYALKCYTELASLCNAYFPGRYSIEDIIKVALFKDLYRAEMYEAYQKNVKNEQTGEWQVVSAYRTKEIRPTFGELGFSSYMIAKHFIAFTDEQIEAICHCRSSDYVIDIKDVQKSYPLVALTKMADLATTYFQ